MPSLTGFVGWLEAGEVTVKRDLAQAGGQIRVMTVHGAKGLEAPVVILPDTGFRRGEGRRAGSDFVHRPRGRALVWAKKCGRDRGGAGPPSTRKSSARPRKRNRLLYVAMTRAGKLADRGGRGQDPQQGGAAPEDSWYEGGSIPRDGLEASWAPRPADPR